MMKRMVTMMELKITRSTIFAFPTFVMRVFGCGAP
jgi:hypothetical protein